MLAHSARSHTKDDFLCHLGICVTAQYFGMTELAVWSFSQLEVALKSVTGFVNSSWDKDTLMQAMSCAYEATTSLSYSLLNFVSLALSTSAPNNPLAYQQPLSSNLDTCVALYKDPDLPITHPLLFGFVFTVVLSLGHRSSVWTNQLTREDRTILYAAQVNLVSLGEDPDFDLLWLSQSPSEIWDEGCSDSCYKDADAAWSASFAWCGTLDSNVPLVDISTLARLPSYRQLFADSTRPNFKLCKDECASRALLYIDTRLEEILETMHHKYEYFVE